MTGHHHNVDTENRQAIAAGPNMPDKPPRYRSSPPTPSDFVGILPPPLYATYWGYLSQADTHLIVFAELDKHNYNGPRASHVGRPP
jgi:hypothetical protein